MSVNSEKANNIVRLVDSLIMINNRDNNLTEEMVEELIQTALSVSNADFTTEELVNAKNEITSKYKIYAMPGASVLDDYEQVEWYTNRKSKIEQKFWYRYKNYLIDEKKFSPNIVSVLGDDTLDQKLMNYIGDPKANNNFFNRGLIIGDVQSGKTSTYIGLMCKAADAGYKVFILLTGTIESLRKQTQERVEEGFIGIDMTADSPTKKRVGVGLDNKSIFAMSMTSRNSDFVGNIDKIATSLGSHDAIVFVIKKNTTVLKKLTDWLLSIDADPITKKIDVPMLLIDDEADNASVNTSSDKEDPTKINNLIRNLANVFTKSNYVGFTATPFANVFIDPETTENMLNYDLFPENFIVALPTPSNYIGASEIFSENGKHHSQLIYIKDAGITESDGKPFYFKHKKDWDDELPSSLTDAIYSFYIANAIRDLRGDMNEHRSMLINMSRFVAVQYCIKSKVEEIHNNAYRSLKFNLSRNFETSMKDPIIKRIYLMWKQNFSDVEFEWKQIAEIIFSSIENIQIRVVNSSKKSEKLDYPKSEALRVIAIGGLALSRGLTLEGLVTSYFYRNTCTYDVLMQMGRWFGYRRGYDDLFRIWTHQASAQWYAEISEATDRLKRDMSIMRERGQKPKEFGIRVRNNSTDLNITARNKMRNTTDEIEFTSYFGNLVETPYLKATAESQKDNFTAVYKLIEECVNSGFKFDKIGVAGEHYVMQDVPKIKILQLIKSLKLSKYSSHFDTAQIYDFLSNCADKSVDMWDIAFMDGSKHNITEEDMVDLFGRKIIKVKRKNCVIEPDVDRLRIGQRGKLGGPNDGIVGIVDTLTQTATEIIELAKQRFREDYFQSKNEKFGEGKTYSSDTWFKYVENRKPLLIVYYIDVYDDITNSAAIEKFRNELGGIPAVGLGLGLPKNETAASKNKFKANKIYNWFEKDEILSEEDEE